MNRGFTLFEMFVYLAVITMLVLIVRGIWISQTDPQAIAHREAAAYERAYPCINRIRYIRSTGKSDSLTPMIDPNTMQPQLCGPEKP